VSVVSQSVAKDAFGGGRQRTAMSAQMTLTWDDVPTRIFADDLGAPRNE
jgi:hypothetical protein